MTENNQTDKQNGNTYVIHAATYDNVHMYIYIYAIAQSRSRCRYVYMVALVFGQYDYD